MNEELFNHLDLKASEKTSILGLIETLKKEKPLKWKNMLHKLTNELARREGIFSREFPKIHSEMIGIKCIKPRALPLEDNYSESSFP